MLIFLLGFMGSGKSHCGKKIAVHLGVPFIDLDEEIEKAEKKSISNLFAEEGEVEFRKMEASALRAFVKKYSIDKSSVNAVVSCGGGTPCYHDNMDFMNQHGLTVWLNPAIEMLVDRLKKEQDHRPLIAGMSEDELEKFITSKLAERVSFYSKATLHINNSECSIDLIEKKLKNE
jgi:shikimate kinase